MDEKEKSKSKAFCTREDATETLFSCWLLLGARQDSGPTVRKSHRMTYQSKASHLYLKDFLIDEQNQIEKKLSVK
jgi:hypothetical protein